MEASSVRAPLTGAFAPRSTALLRLRSDEQLVAQFRAGNEDAFRVLHDRYRQRLFAYVRQMLPAGPRADAEDVLQDVFARAYVALRADERPMAARAWLYRVAHNRCVDALRRPAPVPTELPEVAASDLHDPLTEAARREDLTLLVTDLGRLPEQQRSAILMRELEGLSYADLAAALDCTLPAVKSLLVRARMGLAEASCARDTACAEIRGDLAQSCEGGRRTSALARRHLRDCSGCRDYREALRGTSRGLGALAPAQGPLTALLKLLGLGGSGAAAGGGGLLGGGASAGGGAAGGGLLGGGGTAGLAAGGGAVAATATKVAVAVCCLAGVAGGAREIERHATPKPAPKAAAASATATLTAPVTLRRADPLPAPGPQPSTTEKPRHTASAPVEAATPVVEPASEPIATDASGGALAPDDTAEEPLTEDRDAAAPATTDAPAAGDGTTTGQHTTPATTPASTETPKDTAPPPATVATDAAPASTGGAAATAP